MLELDISPRHSKYGLIDDLVVASALRNQWDQGAQSLVPHQSEGPYCIECYCEIIKTHRNIYAWNHDRGLKEFQNISHLGTKKLSYMPLV